MINLMSRKGFVDPILLGAGALIMVCLVVLGFSLVHFKGVNLGALMPHISSIQNASTSPQTSTTSAITSIQKTSVPTPTNATPGSGVCRTSMSCFIAAAKTCSPATVAFTGTINVSTLFAESVQNALAIKGLNGSGRCIFLDDAKSVTGIVTPQFLVQAQAQGLTSAQAQQEVQYEAQQSAGITSECTFTTSALVSLLTDWSKGPVNANTFTAGNCTSNSTANVNVNVSVPTQSSGVAGTSGTASVPNPPPPTTTNYVSASDLASSDPVVSTGGAVVIEINNMMIEATNITNTTLTGVASLSGVNKDFSLTAGESVTEFGYSITLVRIGVTGESAGKTFLGGTLHIVQQ